MSAVVYEDEAVATVLEAWQQYSTAGSKLNVIEALQDFCTQKYSQDALVVYDSDPSIHAPFVCYVTLPGGACFGNAQLAPTRSEARRTAAKLALLNLLVNQHPSRTVTEEFISSAVNEAAAISGNAMVARVYETLLAENINGSFLEFSESMLVLQLLQWHGTLRALVQQGLTFEQLMEKFRAITINDNLRSQIALDWLCRENQQPGTIQANLREALSALEAERAAGKELRLLKEKRDILVLAASQVSQQQPAAF